MRAALAGLAVVAAVAAVAAPAAAGPGPAGLAADTPQELLGGRLTVKLPKAMALVPRAHDIMSAPESGEDETRAMLDLGSARFVMMTYEPYLAAGPDFKAAVAAEAKAEAMTVDKIEPVAVAKPLVAFAVVPPAPKGSEDANLLLSVWIESADHTAQLVEFYVNPDGAKDAAAWTALARRIATTLAPGKRKLDLAAGARKLGDLTLAVPAGWSLATQAGPDFTVYHLRALGTLGGDGPSTCGVYVGDFPSFQYEQAGIDTKTVKSTPGKLLGTKVDWKTWSTAQAAMTEAMAPHGGAKVHVFCTAKTDASLGALRAMAETLR